MIESNIFIFSYVDFSFLPHSHIVFADGHMLLFFNSDECRCS